MTTALPAKVLDQHVAILGKTGSGKSYTARGIVEGLLDQERRACVIDPKGDWWGLRLSASGKSAGYPVVIFGGEHADVPINARSGTALAELIATGNRPSIIDLSQLSMDDRGQVFRDFAAGLFRHNRGPLHLVIDEVHNFAFQGRVLDVEGGKLLHWANRLASEGRGKGIQIIMASQRPQKVHKDTLTCAETLVAMRVVHALDRQAIKEWMDGAGDPAKSKIVLDSLAGMKRGDAWVWSPEIGHFEPARFPKIKTYDSMSQQAELVPENLKGWAEVNLDEVRQRLADVVKEAEANDPAKLKGRIRELEKQLAARPTAAPAKVQVAAVEGAMAQAAIRATERARRDFRGALAPVVKQLGRTGDTLTTAVRSLTAMLEAPTPAPTTNGHAPKPRATPLEQIPDRAPHLAAVGVDGGPLPVGERAILSALIQYPDGLRRKQLTVITGYKRSTRDAYLQRLRERGFVGADGELMQATDDGRGALPDAEPLPAGEALREYWQKELPAGEWSVLAVLIDQHPSEVDRDEITNRTGYKRSTRDAYLQRLEAKELVSTGRGTARASDDLF